MNLEPIPSSIALILERAVLLALAETLNHSFGSLPEVKYTTLVLEVCYGTLWAPLLDKSGSKGT